MKASNKNNNVISTINHLIITSDIRFLRVQLDNLTKDLSAVELQIHNSEYTILINDEYNDLAIGNDILNFILVFRELKLIEDSTDYLHWCKITVTDANDNKLLAYYKTICIQLDDISRCFLNHTIDYFVTDLDFQLNTVPVPLLRK